MAATSLILIWRSVNPGGGVQPVVQCSLCIEIPQRLTKYPGAYYYSEYPMSTLLFGVGLDYQITFQRGFWRKFSGMREPKSMIGAQRGWLGMDSTCQGDGEFCPRGRLRAFQGDVAREGRGIRWRGRTEKPPERPPDLTLSSKSEALCVEVLMPHRGCIFWIGPGVGAGGIRKLG